MTKVCRLCLHKLQKGSKYFNINAVESFTGFMPYRDQLTTCIPEMGLDMIPNPVVCNYCRTTLKAAYDFKTRCLLVEKKIREFVEEKMKHEDTEICEGNYNLSEIDISDLPPLGKFVSVENDVDKEESISPETTSNNSELMLQLKKEVVTLQSRGEIEVINVPKRNGKYSRGKFYTSRGAAPQPPRGRHSCNKCHKEFNDVGQLLLHTSIHGELFTCNFCNVSFKSLQFLRRHNSMCSKASRYETTIITKRPHLPTKAKNHLKRWLFKHTDHPYPTDHEKQILMKETNLSLLQVENWFINARRRILQDLTKLKTHGIQCEDVADHPIDFEELIRCKSRCEIEEGEDADDNADVEEEIPYTQVVKRIKADPDHPNENEVEILPHSLDPLDVSKIKSEVTEDIPIVI